MLPLHARPRRTTAFGLAALVLLGTLAPNVTDADEIVMPDSAGRPTLSLAALERAVLERNPGVAQARAAWAEARARADLAGAFEAPMLDVMVAPRSFRSSVVEPAWRVELTQAVPLFGQRGLRRASARYEARGAEEELRLMRLDLVHMTRTAYYEYYRIARSQEANRELAVLLGQMRRVALARYAAGTVEQQDPLRADVELAMLDHEVVTLDRQRLVVVAMLNTLMHRPAEGGLAAPPVSIAPPDTSLHHGDLAPRARAQRPELRMADAHVDAANAELRLSRRERLPDASLGVVHDRYMMEPELRTSVTMGLSLPILSGRGAGVREMRAGIQRAEARREVVRDSIELQVAIAAARFHEQAHDLEIAALRRIPLSERALRSARASYEAGRSDFTTLLDAMRNHLNARLDYYGSLSMLHMARADLDRALGDPAMPAGEEVVR
jgi:outer membrane protein TolC